MSSTEQLLAPPPKRPLHRRYVPARVRQQAAVIGSSLLALILVLVGLGSFQLRPIVFSQSLLEPPAIHENIEGLVDLFDTSVPHKVTIDISAVEYQKMISDFQKDGSKTWIRADAVIDGTYLSSVGIRLKGNSTLMSLRGGRGGVAPPGRGATEAQAAPSVPPSLPAGAEKSKETDTLPTAPTDLNPSAAGRGGPGGTQVSFDDPSTLPLLISFNRFTKGRGYQGRAELALRPSVHEGTNLNEATALELVRLSGQASQQFTWVRLRMNGSEARTRLIIENPDQSYAERLGYGTGALFKSKSTNRFAYQGEDPTEYTQDFSQLNAKGVLDLAPLIRLLRFLEQSDDATFSRELSRWLDLTSFARYVATQELLNNFDDMSGPGRNFLVWYGARDERFKILSWDLNLAITGMGGGAGGAGRGGAPPGGAPPGELPSGTRAARSAPTGATSPPNRQTGTTQERGDLTRDRGGPSAERGGGMQHGNRLKERFLASSAFATERSRATSELRALWFESGRATALVHELARQIPRTGELTDTIIQQTADSLVKQLETLAQTNTSPPHSSP